MIALEETGIAYAAMPVILANGEQLTDAYRKLNPKGKVPALRVGDHILTETIAILDYLAKLYPKAALLPIGDPLVEATALATLAWCASGLHPLVTRLRLPQKFCDHPGTADRVRELARNELAAQLGIADERPAHQDWLPGRHWSIADTYLAWVWGRCVPNRVSIREAIRNWSGTTSGPWPAPLRPVQYSARKIPSARP
ncbi:MAG: glutathione S-transferase family protein [Sulfuritalea sp.]|nr:glutathione S-transferase family protein [Sulfuritalea sp.]